MEFKNFTAINVIMRDIRGCQMHCLQKNQQVEKPIQPLWKSLGCQQHSSNGDTWIIITGKLINILIPIYDERQKCHIGSNHSLHEYYLEEYRWSAIAAEKPKFRHWKAVARTSARLLVQKSCYTCNQQKHQAIQCPNKDNRQCHNEIVSNEKGHKSEQNLCEGYTT